MTKQNPEGPVVFLCYAHEDRAAVHTIYLSLRENSFRPWMDKPPPDYLHEGLEPGSTWDTEIRQRIRNADYFLACISTKSATKEGYVQREYRLALSQMAEVPDGEIFLIPVLLEDCTPPRTRVDTVDFQGLHWFRLYEDGINALIGTLERREQRLDRIRDSADPLLVGGTGDLKEAVERHKRVLEEGSILHVELHDTVTEFDDELQDLMEKAKLGKLARNQIVRQFAMRLARFAGKLAPLVDDLNRERKVKAQSFVETSAIMSDSEAADQEFLERQIKLHRRNSRMPRVVRQAVEKTHQILVAARIRDSREFNRSRRQAVVVLERLRDNLREEEEEVNAQLEDLRRLQKLLPESVN